MSGSASVMRASVESLNSNVALMVGRRANSEPKPSPCAKNTMNRAMRARRMPAVMWVSVEVIFVIVCLLIPGSPLSR